MEEHKKDQSGPVQNPAGGRKLSSGELMQEAERQAQALKMIGRWRTIGFVVSAVGAVLLYSAVARAGGSLPLTAVGVLVMAAGLFAAVLCDLGIRNGRRNVEKILDAAQKGSKNKADLRA